MKKEEKKNLNKDNINEDLNISGMNKFMSYTFDCILYTVSCVGGLPDPTVITVVSEVWDREGCSHRLRVLARKWRIRCSRKCWAYMW